MSEDKTLNYLWRMNKHYLKKWWVWVIAIFLMTRFCSTDQAHKENNTNLAPITNEETSPQTTPTPLPKDELAFYEIIKSAQSQNSAASNDMQRGGIKAKRDKAVCNLLKKLKIKDWVGEIATISANSDGKGIVSIALAKGITLQTWNNEYSDMEDKTLLNPDSKIFQEVSSMSVGQMVRFSGSFRPGIEGECVKEGSLRLEGKLSEPEFIFRFSNIEALELSNEETTEVTKAIDASPTLSATKNDNIKIKMTAKFEDIPNPTKPNGNKIFVHFHNIFNANFKNETDALTSEITSWLTSKGYQLVKESIKANTIVDIELFQDEARLPTSTLTMNMHSQVQGKPLVKMASVKFIIEGHGIDIFSRSRTAEVVTNTALSRSPLGKTSYATK